MIKDEFGNRRFFGIYRGVVFDNADPLNRGRLRVQVPQVFVNEVTGWAWPVVPANATEFATVPVGTGVWVMFEGGDPSFPIWTGLFAPLA